MIVEHPNDLVRDQYVMRLAGRLDIAPDRLRTTVATALAKPHTQPAGRPRPPSPALAVDRRELDALRWAVQAPELMSGRLHVNLFVDPIARRRSTHSRAGPGTNASIRHHPRWRRCCSGSRWKSPKRVSRLMSVSYVSW